MKRLAAVVALILLAGAIWYPYDGIWAPAQIASATVDGQPVPTARIPALYWDLHKSRFGGAPSKCAGWVELHLADGERKQARLSETIALERWASICGG